MNIQIFGTKKCFDTKKAERFFKERGVKIQRIDLLEKGISRGELQSVAAATHGLDNVLNPDCKDQETYTLVQYLTADAKLEKILDNPQILKTPIVRNGKEATIGYAPEIWKQWCKK